MKKILALLVAVCVLVSQNVEAKSFSECAGPCASEGGTAATDCLLAAGSAAAGVAIVCAFTGPGAPVCGALDGATLGAAGVGCLIYGAAKATLCMTNCLLE